MRAFAFSFVFLVAAAGCSPKEEGPDPVEGCVEPNPRAGGGLGEGQSCVTSDDCASADHVCMGIGQERATVCTAPTDLFETECPEDPEASPKHRGGRVSGPVEDDDGCMTSTYEVEDVCCRDEEGDCRFDCKDFRRREVWRRCECCWRLISFIEVDPAEL